MELEGLRTQVIEGLGMENFALAQAKRRRGAVGNFCEALARVPEGCELVAFCDQDDVWEPEKLATMVDLFKDPEVMAAHSDLSLIDERGKPMATSCWDMESRDSSGNLTHGKLIMRNPINGCAMMFRRALLPKVLPLPEQPKRVPYFYHDVWVALFALDYGKIAVCPKALVRYRQHGGNAVGSAGGVGLPKVGSIREKCLRALKTRQELEREYLLRSESAEKPLYSSALDFGLPIFIRALWWSLVSSRGYLRIGLQLALGKLFWDLSGQRETVWEGQ